MLSTVLVQHLDILGLLSLFVAGGSFSVSMATLLDRRHVRAQMAERATHSEVERLGNRITAIESKVDAAPGWAALNVITSELRGLHGRIEGIAGEMRSISHNTDLILEHLVRDRENTP